ncbi:MAG: hypothetical protein ACI9MC_003180, partial [Kiritimatiellia bacterium]
PSLDSIDELVRSGHSVVRKSERDALVNKLLELDPSLEVTSEEADDIEMHPRGRSGASIRLGSITHELFVPDWHEGEAGPPIIERAITWLSAFQQINGGQVFDSELARVLYPAEWPELVERYVYGNQPLPQAPDEIHILMGAEAGKAFGRICDFLFRKLALNAPDRAWFLDAALSNAVTRDAPNAPMETNYNASMRRMQVVAFREVVDHLVDPVNQIAIGQARSVDRECQVGEELMVPTPAALSADGRSQVPYDLPAWASARWNDEQVIKYLSGCLSIP